MNITQADLANGTTAQEAGNALSITPDAFGTFPLIFGLILVITLAYVLVAKVLPALKQQDSPRSSSAHTYPRSYARR